MVLIYIYKPSLTFDLFMKSNSKKKLLKMLSVVFILMSKLQ